MKRVTLLCCFWLITSLGLQAQLVSWDQLGKSGEWKATIACTSIDFNLYTVESSGGLFKTDLNTGKWKQLGKSEFGNTKFLFSTQNSIYSIESDGSLYKINPNDGSWSQIGKKGAWKATKAATIFNNQLYTVESSGALYQTNLYSGKWKQIGGLNYANTKFLFKGMSSLFTIETDGSLYQINPQSGSWKTLGKPGDWKNTILGTTIDDFLYSIEKDGILYETNLATGKWQAIGKPEYAQTKFIVQAKSNLFTIESQGSLYQIYRD